MYLERTQDRVRVVVRSKYKIHVDRSSSVRFLNLGQRNAEVIFRESSHFPTQGFDEYIPQTVMANKNREKLTS